jgi:hypothetical protein
VGSKARERIKPEVWQMVLRHYGTLHEVGLVCECTRQSINSAVKSNTMPAIWASKIHRDTNGILDARILCPEVFIGVY